MARPLRIEYPGAYYHVMNRGNARNNIFLTDDDYDMFLTLLEESSRLFNIKILAYCLMTNHYHLLVHTPRGNLSRFMRHLGGVYTQRFNKSHKKDGHLFKGRFKAILIQEDGYLTHLIRYIHLNPVQANLVQDPKDFPWSSHQDYLKVNDKGWLAVTEALGYFSPRVQEAKKMYLEFIREGIDPQTKAFFKMKNQGSVFGDIDFMEKIKETYLLKDGEPSPEIPEKRNMQGESVVKRIKSQVVRYFKIKESGLYSSTRGDYNKPRMIALSLCRELSGLKLREIAQYFNMGAYKTVSSSCQRFKSHLAYDKVAWSEYDNLRRRCIQGET